MRKECAKSALVDVPNIFYFFLLPGEGKGEYEVPGRVGGRFSIENPRRGGGGSPTRRGGGARGREGVCGEF